MSDYLNTVDLLTIVVYLLALVFIGVYLQRKASGSLEEYIVGGKKMPFWALGTSGTAQFLDLSGTTVVVSVFFFLGPQGFFVNFRGHVILFLIVVMLWSGKYHRRSGCLTAAEWNIFRFGDGTSGRFAQIAVVCSAVLATFGAIAYVLVGAGTFLSTFLPYTPNQCALALLVVATGYTMLSGFHGVVVTDLLQSVLVFGAAGLVSYLAFAQVESFTALSDYAMNLTGFDAWSKVAPVWQTELPTEQQDYEYVTLFAGFFMLKAILFGLGAGNDPKYMGARSDKDCVLLSFVTATLTAIRWPMMIGLAVLGLYMVGSIHPNYQVVERASAIIHDAYPDLKKEDWGNLISGISDNPEAYPAEMVEALEVAFGGSENWKRKVQLVGYHGHVNAEKVLPMVVVTSINPGLRGLMIVALVAAAMSTFDSSVNWVTGLFTRDIYQKYWRPKAQQKELIYASWFFTASLVTGSYLFITKMGSINDVYKWINVGLQSGFLVPTILKFYWWRFNGTGFAGGMLTGITWSVAQRLFFPDIPEMHLLGWSVAMGAVGAVVGTYLTPPTEEAVLGRFYRKTLPMGFWGRLKANLPLKVKERAEREHKLDVLALPLGLTWQITLYMAPLLLVIHHFQGFWITGTISVIAFIALYKFWYKKLPDPIEEENAVEDREGVTAK